MRFLKKILNHMVQKYQNEIAPIFYYGISTKTSEKDLKIPNLQPPDWKSPYWMTLYNMETAPNPRFNENPEDELNNSNTACRPLRSRQQWIWLLIMELLSSLKTKMFGLKGFRTPKYMEYREQASPISSHTYDHARTSNTLPTTMPGRLMHYLRQNIGQQHT